MSTDKTKPARKKPADKAAPPPAADAAAAAAAAAPETLAPSNIQPIPYGRLRRAPENVRKTNIAADVESLADDIGAHGLLQSLIGYPGDTDIDQGVVYIVGGGRRLQALQLLRERDVIADEWPVSVLIRGQGEAIELSLSENLARRDMNPADEFEAFAALMKTGATNPAQLGKRFGFTERYVKQRLRLADLAPEILEALREDKIGIESAITYARTADTELQQRVFKAQLKPNAYSPHSAYSIKAAYAAEQMTTDDTVFLFIDQATYEADGGGYDEDLFGALDDNAPRKLTRGDLALAIAERGAEFTAEQLLAIEQEKHPCIGDFLLPKGLKAGGKVETPTGHVEIRRGYSYDLYQDINLDEIWAKLEGLTYSAVIVMHLDRQYGGMVEVGEGAEKLPDTVTLTVDETRVFVPKNIAAKVLPAKREQSYGVQQTPEEREAAELKREGRLWAARIAVPKFSSVPGFDGRVFYEDRWLSENSHKPGDPKSGDYTPSFTVRVYVSEEEIAANIEAGQARAIEERAAREQRRINEALVKEAEEAARADALAAKIEELAALGEAPAVIMADTCNDQLWPYFRREDGSYFDQDDEEGYNDLAELIENADVIGGHWPTREAYDAAQAELVDEEATEDA